MKVTPGAALALLCVFVALATVLLVTWWAAQHRSVLSEATMALGADRQEPR